MEWWTSLSALSQVFLTAAVFISILFGWQTLSALGGLGGEHAGGEAGAAGEGHFDTGEGHLHAGDAGAGHGEGGIEVLRLLSLRSILAFGMLFTWAGFLYLQRGVSITRAMVWALGWGVIGVVAVALFFSLLPRLTEEGTASLDTAIGQQGRVYLDIPRNGTGEIRVVVSGTVRFVKARSSDGRPLRAGTAVRVVRRLDSLTLEVERSET